MKAIVKAPAIVARRRRLPSLGLSQTNPNKAEAQAEANQKQN